MPYYTESQALYIDFARLPPPNVIEVIDYERLVAIYQSEVVRKLPALSRAVSLQQSPTNVVLQAEAYGEYMVRARINSAARAVMLPFAKGSDLDVLAAFYNVARAPIVENPQPFLSKPEDWESDTRFRMRVQLAPEAFSMGGTAGAYRFHALTALPTLRDASAMKIDDRAGVKVTLLGPGDAPDVGIDDIMKVKLYLERKNIKPLTDVLSVSSATRKITRIIADVQLYPGPDASLVAHDITQALTRLRAEQTALGRDLTRSALIKSIHQEGVLDVRLHEPVESMKNRDDEISWIDSVEINFNPVRSE